MTSFDLTSFAGLILALGIFGGLWFAARSFSPKARLAVRVVLAILALAPLLFWFMTVGSGPARKAGAPPPRPVATAPASAPGTDRTVAIPASPPGPAEARSPPQVSSPEPVPLPHQYSFVPVFYGTDRKAGGSPKRLVYTDERGGRLELGRALVTVPKKHEMPNIERPWVVRLPFTEFAIWAQAEDPEKHFTMREIRALSREEFLVLVRARFGAPGAGKKRAVVFVHGYNTEFDYAVYRTAQMAYDLNFDGVPFLYSWPSASGLLSYTADLWSAQQAEPYLREFLEIVVRETGAAQVSVIAHSMGNLPLLRVLKEIAPKLPEGVKLDQVILAAPDIDRGLFAQLAGDLAKVGRGVTLYASSNDRAMEAARRVGGAARAGDIPVDGPVIVSGIDTIDASAMNTDTFALNHSFYAERTALVADIAKLISSGQRPPEARAPGINRVKTPNGDYWRFTK